MSPVFNEAKYRALLEKLEISEVCYLNTCIEDNISRFDAEFYQKIYFEAEQKVKANSWVTLKQLNVCLDCSAFYPSVANDYNFNFIGVPFLRVNEIIDGKIIFSDNTAFLPESLIKEYNDTIRLAYNNDILIAKGGNTAGKVGFISSKYDYYATCRDVVILRTNKISKINPQILSLYLQCDFGKLLIEKTISQTGQPHLTLPLLERLPIPLILEKIQYGIKKCTDLSIQCSEKSHNIYVKSEHLLLQELGLPDWQPDDESVATKTFADFQTSGRLDAEYYQPKYDEYLAKVKSYSGGVSILANHFEQNKATTTFSLPQYNYIEIGDINVGNGEASFNLVQTEELPANAKYVIQQGDILISKVRPYRGAVSIIDFEPQDVIASGAFTILRENGSIRKEVLSTLLRIPLYKDWLLKWNVGSSYPVIKDEDILNLAIPVIKQEIQDQIAEKVQESFALRKESKRLLDLAKHAVEVAIEQGEDAAMKLLEDVNGIH